MLNLKLRWQSFACTNIDRGVRRWCLLMFVVQSFAETWTFFDPLADPVWQKDLWLACHVLWLTTYLGEDHNCKVLTPGKMNKGNIQTSALPSRRPPHICDGWHRLDEALLLCILPCAQIWVVPKILRNCQMVGVVRLTWRGQVQVVVAAAKLAVGGSCKKDAKLRAGLMEAYLCDEAFWAVFFPLEIRLIEGFNEACSIGHYTLCGPYHHIMMLCYV